MIVGLTGHRLSREEAAFLARHEPGGLIIFKRNYYDEAQLAELIRSAKDAANGQARLVLVDQEGGRVQRLRGDGWPELPAAAAFGALYARDPEAALEAARTIAAWLGGLLRQVGINVNCAPCVDVPVDGAHDIIGDRAYGRDPEQVAALGGAVAEGLMAGGVVPVMKHIPGHGRAMADSHHALPVVDSAWDDLVQQDFVPFEALRWVPAAMTAHVTYPAIDATAPASTSAVVMRDVVRGAIGYDGLVMSDDISMRALSGAVEARASAVLAAGSDMVLHCNGRVDEMMAVAEAAPVLSGDGLRRYEACVAVASRTPDVADPLVAARWLGEVRRAGGDGVRRGPAAGEA